MYCLPFNTIALCLMTLLLAGCAFSKATIGHPSQNMPQVVKQAIQKSTVSKRKKIIRIIKRRRVQSQRQVTGQSSVQTPFQETSFLFTAPVRQPTKWDHGGKHISLHFRHAPLQALLDVLQKHSGKSFVVDPELAAKELTISLHKKPWRDALQAIARVYEFAVYEDKGMVLITQPSSAQEKSTLPSTTRALQSTGLFRLNYITPQVAQTALKPLFQNAKEKPSFSIDPRTRSLLIKGNAADTALAKKLVNALDQPARQIEIEAFIVEVNSDFARTLGTRLGLTPAEGSGTAFTGVADNGSAINLPVNQATFGVAALLDQRRLRIELTALEQEGKSKIISNPKIFALENHPAVIFQGEEIPYQTVSENGTQTSFKEAGIRLEVTPSIVGQNYLLLQMTVNKDSVDTRVPNPPITRRQITTTLKVLDKAVVVIGGIYLDDEVSAIGRVPLLGDIPLLGHLFERRHKKWQGRELLVFIAPKIVI